MTLLLLFGGRSDERHVSVASAQNVARSLAGPQLWFWAADGRVYDVAAAELLSHQRPFEADFEPSRPALWPDLEMALDTLPVEDPLFVLALHGGEGEDGTVQRMLERRGIPFTGAGSEASAAAFDKGWAKEIVAGRLRVPQSRVAPDGAGAVRAARELFTRHEKLVLKPVAGGSSRGLFFADRSTDLERIAKSIDVPYLVEELVAGRELTVGVVEREGALLALPVIEIEMEPGRDFDYEGKYLGAGSREICPADIPEVLRDAAQQAALIAHEALGCAGYSRTDVIAAEGGVTFIELNTLPGLTKASLLPQELAAAGIGFAEFLEEQIAIARRRGASVSSTVSS
jgi:D-alanine-D-alanine ligase